jgi:hypothetical protein
MPRYPVGGVLFIRPKFAGEAVRMGRRIVLGMLLAVFLMQKGQAATLSRADWYVVQLSFAAQYGEPIAPPSMLGEMMITLLDNYVPIDREVTIESLPHFLAAGFRTMYLEARSGLNTADGFILKRLQENPNTAYWTFCGYSTDLMTLALAAFGVDARTVSLFSSIHDNHVALEYYSRFFDKYVFYDPLYGALLVNDSGVPASLQDILSQIEQYGFETRQWAYQPIRIYGLFAADDYRAANDPQYESYNSRDYHEILRNYFNVVASRRDYTPYVYYNSGTVPGEQWLRGTWDVYHYIAPNKWEPFRTQLVSTYSSRYTLRFVN